MRLSSLSIVNKLAILLIEIYQLRHQFYKVFHLKVYSSFQSYKSHINKHKTPRKATKPLTNKYSS